MHEADQSGKYDPLPVKVPVEAVKTWHDAEARGKGLASAAFFFLLVLREVDAPGGGEIDMSFKLMEQLKKDIHLIYTVDIYIYIILLFLLFLLLLLLLFYEILQAWQFFVTFFGMVK